MEPPHTNELCHILVFQMYAFQSLLACDCPHPCPTPKSMKNIHSDLSVLHSYFLLSSFLDCWPPNLTHDSADISLSFCATLDKLFTLQIHALHHREEKTEVTGSGLAELSLLSIYYINRENKFIHPHIHLIIYLFIYIY